MMVWPFGGRCRKRNLKHAKPVSPWKRAQRPELARADLGAAMPDVIAREVDPAQGRLGACYLPAVFLFYGSRGEALS